MNRLLAPVRRLYGAHPLHLLILLGCFFLAGYAAINLSADAQWPYIALWFAGAVIAHDFVLFPLYALADRLITGRRRPEPKPGPRRIAVVNHVRIPLLASGLLLLLFFPGIIAQGSDTFTAATGQTQEPFLARWLVLSAGFFALSAVLYLVRTRRARERPKRGGRRRVSGARR
ncbi:hypothetical protein GCM10022222_33800 [Amycolatopsis ultiminotia]|uniref:Lipoprotein n=1 Tax=Amycolatopsis ultiminotia TaxID=543629 RepID=A0ABP6W6S5_9PSEU